MKLFFDFLPIVIFFAAFKLSNIYVATAVAMGTVLAQILYTLIRTKKIEMMPLITFVMIMVLGGATLIFRNEIFIKWKPSVVYWIFSLAFLVAGFFTKKPLVQKLLENSLSLPQKAWARLNTAWIIFFLLMGFINLFVVYNFSTETWVNFKLFGTLGITLAFVLIQGIIISRFLPQEQKEKPSE